LALYTVKRLQKGISEFNGIGLDQLDQVSLMKRMDDKYVFPLTKIEPILEAVIDQYNVLEINNKRIMGYSTVYYDTDDLELFRLHQRGKLNRYKVRERTYVDSSISFLEIKLKNNKNKTIKTRIPVSEIDTGLENEKSEFILNNSPINPMVLKPSLWVNFNRITFVSKANNERATLDTGLHYFFAGKDVYLHQVAIFETKRNFDLKRTPMMGALKKEGIRPSGFSKYCFGIPHIYPNVKRNALKRRFLMIDKIENNKISTAL